MLNNLFYLYLFFSVFFEIVAQYLYKLVHLNKIPNILNKQNLITNPKNIYIIIGILFYALTGYFAFKLLKYGELVIINIIWHLVHFFILFLIGYFLLNEKLNLKKIIACIFGMISLILFLTELKHH